MQKYKVYINNKLNIITDWKSFISNYTIIDAAGGVVFNNKKQLLMILRNGKWDLPKGKIEMQEDITCCALREVEEECGLSGLIITEKIKETYHTYSLNGDMILKRTYWFRMETDFNDLLKPQLSEGITLVAWVDMCDIKEKLADSFKSIKDLIDYEIS